MGSIEKQKRLKSYQVEINTASLELENVKLKATRPFSKETLLEIENFEMRIRLAQNKLTLES